MCGIAGVYQLNGRKVPIEAVEAIGALMNHRGPDNFGFTSFEKLGFSHNRLSLLDLSSAANQPFKNEDYVLTFNGEIYNFFQIRERLTRDYGVQFKTTSDTEVLFYSLINHGIEETLKQIKGMFAFAFYDKSKNELWLARDRLGIKPLYYIQHNGGFYWSSEVKALARTLDLKPDPLKTVLSINGMAEQSVEFTLFKGLYPIKPGTFVKIGADAREPEFFTYYTVLDDFDPAFYNELNARPATDILAEFERLLTESVQNVLISDAPLGSFVSGGIDSSLISAIAKRRNPDIKLFTANVIGKHSEFPDAQTLARYLNTELFDYRFEPEMMLRDWAEVTYFYDCPIIAFTNCIPFSNVAKLARDSNVKAVLTGEGADELFLGYPRLLAKRYDQFAALPVTIVKSFYKLVPKLDQYLFPDRKNSATEFANQLVQNFVSSRRRAEAHSKLDFLPPSKRSEQWLTMEMLGNHLVNLLQRNDRMGMLASIEARFPFLDENLVRFGINLPAKFKIGRSSRWHNYKHPFLIDKWVIRKTAEKYLPTKLAYKKKNGFPMSGHKAVRIKKGFFANGWIEENLSISIQTQQFMLESQDPYFIAKLASVEIFGRLFGLGETIETVQSHVLRHAEMIS